MSLMDKVCIITGSSRGIGKEIAAAFAKEGANIVISFRSQEDAAKETAEEIVEKYDAEVEIVKADVSKEEEVVEIVERTRKRFGTVDILVNNAGVHKDSVVWKMDKNVWEEVISTNLTGVFLCTKHVVPIMREKSWGRIVNISSVAGQIGLFGASNYSASKSGLFGFTKTVAREVANRNITVNCVAFGYVETGMNLRLSEEIRQKVLQEIPMRRFGKVEEVSGPIVFLCTDEAAYITGQIIHINGGYYM
ncbi:MAG TPA: 3-oxoacyl-ACP reductase family protein [Patescibacteria group bacterium]|nr:3-oxoacyl-ACP reductase family protein [Patescibacteria group bacterium]